MLKIKRIALNSLDKIKNMEVSSVIIIISVAEDFRRIHLSSINFSWE